MPSSARDYPNVFRGSGYYQPGQVVSNGFNSFRVTQSPGRTRSGAVKVAFKPLPAQKAAPAPAPPPAPAPAPAAPTQPSYKPQPIEGLVSAKLDEVIKAVSAPKPAPAPPPAPPKILFSGSTPLTASPLQIGPANPRSLVGGTSKFKRQGGVNNQLKINQSVNV